MEFEQSDAATPLDPDEADGLIPTHITTMGQLNEWEQSNILTAETWLFGRRRRGILTDAFVRTLHRRMFDKTWAWSGKYRGTDKNLGDPWPSIPLKVRQVCENTSYFLENQTFSIEDIAVRHHHSMVSVHPFPNGNGRHTRLLADVILFGVGEPRFNWGGGDLQRPSSTAKKSYIAALRKADQGEFSDLLKFARS